ncbi:putative HTH-type transcriptional repressor ExuR [Thalassocella blandensis]|nr:putative HTH-type transcriptional repressor ExuR [Thalassocella blandensis]
MSKRKPTSQEIANIAGVSQPTVSRALRNSPLVSEETRAKIFAIARELNYPLDNLNGHEAEISKKSFTVIFAENPADSIEGLSPFFLALLNAIVKKAARLDYGIHLGLRHATKNWNLALDEALHHGCGIIFLGNQEYVTYKDKLLAMRNREIPFTAWGPVLPNQHGVFIGFDNVDGGFQATNHLIKLGHEKIAFIGNIGDFRPEFSARYQGYSKALLQADIIVDPKLRTDAQSNDQDGYLAIKRLFDNKHEFSAVVCASDIIAISVIKALKELGKRIPQDIAVTGFDDIPIAGYLNPALTTVKQDTKRAGELLVEQLVHMTNGSELQSIELPVELILRQTCGHSM